MLASQRIELAGDDEVQEHFWSQGWTDGLPVIPPTADRVARFLDHAGLAGDRVVGSIPERGREITAEKVAINAVMAGCRPDYLPILLAAWQAMCVPEWNLNSGVLSTSGPAPLMIVNGPIVKRLEMRSGGNLFGPGNRANATLGRAVRLMLINLAGAAGDFDKANTGHPGKYSYCIAEDEEPAEVAGWEPVHVRAGLDRAQSAVTVINLEAPHHVRDEFSAAPEQLLENYADHVRVWNQGGVGVLLMNPEHRAVLKNAGWTKARAEQYVYERSARTVADMKRVSRRRGAVAPGDDSALFRWARGPEDLMVVGGGSTGWFSACIPPWAGGIYSTPVTRAVPDPGAAEELFN